MLRSRLLCSTPCLLISKPGRLLSNSGAAAAALLSKAVCVEPLSALLLLLEAAAAAATARLLPPAALLVAPAAAAAIGPPKPWGPAGLLCKRLTAVNVLPRRAASIAAAAASPTYPAALSAHQSCGFSALLCLRLDPPLPWALLLLDTATPPTPSAATPLLLELLPRSPLLVPMQAYSPVPGLLYCRDCIALYCSC